MKQNATAELGLNLGCGLNAPPDWVNVDGSFQVVLARHSWLRSLLGLIRLLPSRQARIPWPANVRRLDLKKKLPFVEHRFPAVYSSHLLEHLQREQALALLRECRRVLRPGGVCRAVVPDLEFLVERYLAHRANNGGSDPAREFVHSLHMQQEVQSGSGLYRLYLKWTDYHPHKWMYDARSLILLFQEAGFSQVEQRECHDSRIPTILQVEDEARVRDGAGICVEGVR